MYFMYAQDLSDRGDDIRRNKKAVGVMVSGDMVDNEPKERSKRFRIAAYSGVGKLQNSLVMVAQTAKSNG